MTPYSVIEDIGHWNCHLWSLSKYIIHIIDTFPVNTAGLKVWGLHLFMLIQHYSAERNIIINTHQCAIVACVILIVWTWLNQLNMICRSSNCIANHNDASHNTTHNIQTYYSCMILLIVSIRYSHIESYYRDHWSALWIGMMNWSQLNLTYLVADMCLSN